MSSGKSGEKTVLLWKEKATLKKKARDGNVKKVYWASFRSKLREAEVTSEGGYERWKRRQKLTYARCSLYIKTLCLRLEIWGRSLKKIEGHFGSGVASYFVFLKQLFFLNLMIFFLVFGLIVVPQSVLHRSPRTVLPDHHVTSTVASNLTMVCTDRYETFLTNTSQPDAGQFLLNFLQGTMKLSQGWMQSTLLFYGRYSARNLTMTSHDAYSLPLAYFTVAVAVYAFSLIFMANLSAQSFKENVATRQGKTNQHINLVFCGWDYTMTDGKSAKFKRVGIYQEIITMLQDKRDAERRRSRTLEQKVKLYFLRTLVNAFVICLLGLAGYLIFYVTKRTMMLTQDELVHSMNEYVQLMVEFLPSITITALNVVVPLVFQNIVVVEDYRPTFELNLTLMRTVFLRLASVLTLMGTIYNQITCSPRTECNTGIPPNCAATPCWEVYIGQNFYRLVVMDFVVVVLQITVIEFPRRCLVTRYDGKISELIGRQEFDLPKNVLDLVYSQMLYWIGFFFAPMIPAMAVVKTFAVFYLKKITCLLNYTPSERPYQASRSNEFFMIVLILSYLCCIIPLAYIVTRISPSRGCGPFREYDYMHQGFSDRLLASVPAWVNSLLQFLVSSTAMVIIIIILSLLLYYYSVLSAGYKIRNQLMKEQLASEGKDKQYLLKKLSETRSQQWTSFRPKPTSSLAELLVQARQKENTVTEN